MTPETFVRKNLSLAVLTLLAAGPALAQTAPDLGGAVHQAGAAVAGKLNSDQARAGRVRGGIACGGPAVDQILQTMDEQRVKIAFEPRSNPSGLEISATGPVVKLDDKLPDEPRVLVVYVSHEVSRLMFNDMPECAEKYYMRLSLTAQSWYELGGETDSLPSFEKDYQDPALGKDIMRWAKYGAEFALDAAAHANGVDDLPTLLDKEKDPAKIKLYQQANKRFTDFLYAESRFRQLHADQLKKKE